MAYYDERGNYPLGMKESAERIQLGREAGIILGLVDPVDPPHYADLDPQPWDVIEAWRMGYLDGSVVKYMSRWRRKNGVEDLKKARRFLDKLIEVEEAKG